jgi:Tol biopolymer transport system component/DNA-binding winged helix-turn-helix (wHTH) protein
LLLVSFELAGNLLKNGYLPFARNDLLRNTPSVYNPATCWSPIFMTLPRPESRRLTFGVFTADPSLGRLLKDGIPVKLAPQPFKVLLLLIERRGGMVSREEIREHIWGNSTFVDFERGINFSINQIRAVLCDDVERPRYIETLPKIGYRFIAEVEDDGHPWAPPSSRLFAVAADSYSAVEFHLANRQNSHSQIQAASVSIRSPLRKWVAIATLLAALTIGFFALRVLSRGAHSREISFENLQLLKLPDTGTVKNIAISKDGRYVAYVRVLGEKQALLLRQANGGGDVQVLRPELGNFVGVSFSNDGNSLYFVRADSKDMGFRYLFQVPTLGGTPRKLVADVDSGVAFSPDGRRICYQRWLSHQNQTELKIANADGSAERSLARIHDTNSQSPGDPAPDWSPDGRTIVLSKFLFGAQRRWVVYAVSAETGSIREIYSTINPIGRPIWLRSGNGLLISQYDPVYHRSQLWTITYPHGVAHRFTHDISDYSMEVDYAQDRQTVVSLVSTVQSHIWVSSSTEHVDAQQITSGEHPFFLSKLTPDGRILSTDGYGSLWRMDPDGTQASIFGNLRDVGWFTLCGNYIVASSHENNSTALVRMNLTGSDTSTLVTGNLWSPSCSREGTSVYYMNLDQPQKIWRVPLEGSAPAEVATIQGDTIMGNLSVSPDGKFLAYQYNSWSASSPSRYLAVIPTSGGSPIANFDTQGENWMVGPYWTSDSKAIHYLRVEDAVSNIWEQPLEGGAPKKLTHFTSGHIADFAWSTDRSRLFFTRDKVNTDIVLLTNLH